MDAAAITAIGDNVDIYGTILFFSASAGDTGGP